MPAVDLEILDELWTPNPEWTLEKAKKLAAIMNDTVNKEDVKDMIRKRKAAWSAVTKNRNDFLAAKAHLAQRAKSVNYHIPELTEITCDDCSSLKKKQKALIGTLETSA